MSALLVAVATVVSAATLAVILATFVSTAEPASAQQPTTTVSSTTVAGSGSSAGVTTPQDTASTVDPALAEKLQAGSQVYSQICSACHQPGGAGLAGQYPPLKDNPNVQNTDYVTGVVNHGKQGQLTVLGKTYNGVMPSFSTLSADDVAAVIAYIQGGLVVPASATTGTVSSGPIAGTELPALTNFSALVAYLVAAVGVGLVLAPRLISANSRLAVPWLDAWLKTAAIVVGVVLATVVIPDWALKTSSVAKLGRFGQDVIGVGLWGAGLVAVLLSLWYAHRESRV